MLNIEVNFQECNGNSVTHTMYNGTRVFMNICTYVCTYYVCMYVRTYVYMYACM